MVRRLQNVSEKLKLGPSRSDLILLDLDEFEEISRTYPQNFTELVEEFCFRFAIERIGRENFLELVEDEQVESLRSGPFSFFKQRQTTTIAV